MGEIRRDREELYPIKKIKGIRKLVDAVDDDIAGLVTRLRAVADVSNDYTSFSGLADDMEGQVRFIYKTASVK